MQAWMSWAAFLAIAAAAYFYYAPKASGDARGRSASRPDPSWIDSETKPKAAPKAAPKPKAKAKAPRKSINAAVQEAGTKAEAAFEAATTGAEIEPVTSAKPPSGRDVSDMLGEQAAAPSVLNIKGSEKPTKAPKAKKAEEPKETKKQRQNRQKAEAAKLAREEEEKERQILLEKQRRTAREARGEPAKNGITAKAPSNNPWTTAGAVQAPPSAAAGQLLDTFDAASTTSSSEAPTNGTIPTPDSTSNNGGYNGLPSEEEQLRLAMEDSAWTTIPKGGKKQRAKAEAAPEEVSAPAQPVKAAPAPQVKKAENRAPASRYTILSETFAAKDHPMDSDWPVM